MRLQSHQIQSNPIQSIQTVIQQIADKQVTTWQYGFRLDDTGQSGDVDPLMQSTPPITLLLRARTKTQLDRELNISVDILACGENGQVSPLARIAVYQGERL